jgi:hypothetical protein
LNVLDENILPDQRQRLISWAIHVRKIGIDPEAKRLGNVIHVSPSGLHYWQFRASMEQFARWP